MCLSLHDMHLKPEQRQFHRFLSLKERFRLIGQSDLLAHASRGKPITKTMRVRWSGNACTSSMAASVVLPLVKAAATGIKADVNDEPPPPTEAVPAAEEIASRVNKILDGAKESARGLKRSIHELYSDEDLV